MSPTGVTLLSGTAPWARPLKTAIALRVLNRPAAMASSATTRGTSVPVSLLIRIGTCSGAPSERSTRTTTFAAGSLRVASTESAAVTV
jgi:hypothetical protein